MIYKCIKDDVTLAPQGVTLPLLDALLQAAQVFQRYGYSLVVTSLGDSVHHVHSLHYQGKAADLRIRHVQAKDVGEIVRELKSSLGPAYDVVLEADHVHVEYDPKSG